MISWVICHYCGSEHVVEGGRYRCRGRSLPVIDGDEVFSQPTLSEQEIEANRGVWARDEHLHRVCRA